MDFGKKLLIAVLLLTAACSKPVVRSAPAQKPDLLAQRADPATLAMLRAAGGRATVTFIVRPDRWAETVSAFKALNLPAEGWFEQALAAPDLWSAFETVAGGLYQMKIPQTLPGWDRTRPIVAAFFEPQVNETLLAARALMPISVGADLPGIRHRILVPASDTKALAGALAEWAGQLGFKPVPGSGGSFPLFSLPREDGFVAFVPEAGRVRVEILTNEVKPGTAGSGRASVWRAQAAQAPAGDLLPSPAMAYCAGSQDLLALYLRPWQLRDLETQIKVGRILEAVAFVDPAEKAVLIAAGLAETSTGYLLMSPLGAEMDDLAVGLGSDGGLRLKSIISLTEVGEKIFKAGLASARPIWKPVGQALIQVWTAADLNASLNATVIPPGLAAYHQLEDLARAVQEGGIFCFMHLALRNPFGALKAVLAGSTHPLDKMMPSSLAFNLQGLGLGAMRAAAVLTFAPGQDADMLKKDLSQMERVGMKVELAEEKQGTDTVLRLGINADPRTSFEAEPAKPSAGDLGEAEIDFSQLPVLPPGSGFDELTMLRQLGRVSMRGALADRALVGEMRVVGSGKALVPGPLLKPGEFAGLSWDSPGAKEAATKGAHCLEDVTREMTKAYHALVAVEPKQRSRLLAHAIEEVQPSLDCSLADPASREDAGRTRNGMWLAQADLLLDDWHTEEAKTVLDRACGQGQRPACERARELASRPKVELAQATVSCGYTPGGGNTLFLSDADSVAGLQKADPGSEPVLVVDGKVSYQTLLAALTALTRQGAQSIDLMVARPEGGVSSIQVKVAVPAGSVEETSQKSGLPEKPRLIKKRSFREITREAGEEALEIEEAPVVVKLYKNAMVEVLADGAATSFTGKPAVQGEPPAVDTKALADWMAQLNARLGQSMQVYVDADPEPSWRDLATVMAELACPSQGEGRWISGRKLMMGPVPQEISDRAMMANLSGQLPVGAIFGDTLGDAGGIGTVGSGTGSGYGVGTGLGKKTARADIQPGAATVLGSLAKEAIQKVIRSHQPGMRYCYEKEILKNPTLQGRIDTEFVIDAEGKVSWADVKASTLKNQAVEECALRQIRSYQFPKPKGGGVVLVKYPFVFKTTGTK